MTTAGRAIISCIILCLTHLYTVHAEISDTTRVNEIFLNKPLKEVLDILEDKYNLLVAYDADDVSNLFVHRYISDLELQTALKDIFENSGLEYQFISNKEILVRRERFDEPDVSVVLRGLVVSNDQQTPLSWATVFDSASNFAAYTDQFGRFVLKVPNAPPSGMLKVKYLGYDDVTAVWSKRENDLFISMKSSAYLLNEIVVVQRIPSVVTRVESNGFRKTSGAVRLPTGAAGLKDELSTLKFLPGISATNDLSAGLSIRGGDEDENLYLLDGIEFFNIDHFYGIFSAFDANTIDSTHIYLSDFPSKYGGRTSGVVDMYLKQPGQQELNGQLGIHSIYSFFNITAPLTKKSGLLFSTRFTNGDISDSDIYDVLFKNSSQQNGGMTNNQRRNELFQVVPFFRFNDNQLKWQWCPDKSKSLSATLFRGRDQAHTEYALEWRTKIEMHPTLISETYNESIVWDNTGFNLSYDAQPSSTWKYNLDFSASEYKLTQDIQSKLTLTNPVRRDTINPRNQVGNQVRGASLRWNNDFSIFSHHTFSTGLEVENHQVQTFAFADTMELFNELDTAISFTMFGSLELPINEKMDFRIGARVSKYVPTRKIYASPRLSFTYFPNQKLEFKFSGGVYNQFLRTQVYEDRFGKSHTQWLLANDKFRVLNSTHINLMGIYKTENFILKMEAYNKFTSNELERVWIVNGFNRMTGVPLSNKFRKFYGSGRSIGLDLLTQVRLGQYSANLSYTLSQNTLSISEIDGGEPFPAPDDRRHELTLLNQLTFKNWTFSNTWVYGSGLPFISVKIQDDKDIRNISYEERIDRLKDYFRIDLALDYQFTIWKQDFHVGMSIYNILDRANSDQVQYMYNVREENTSTGQQEDFIFGSEIQLLPRTIDISLEWHF